ncbi:MAG: TlpA family protein disulfide reductase [Anaerolineales bacterium]|nr:TlpA family protein disulfide reductase [Anaerolineales bacterium]
MTIEPNNTRRAQLRESRQRDARRNQAIWALGAAAFILLVAAAAILTPRTDTVERAEIGSPISNFSLVDLNGATHQMADLKGRVVLINAWATWCPPCRAEMPALQEFYQAYQNQGFTLLAVNAGEDAATADAFIQQMGFSFPVLLDPGTNVLVGLGIDAFPTSILIDRDGTVATIHVGYYDPADVAADILPLLTQ